MNNPSEKKTIHDRLAPYALAVLICATAALLLRALILAFGELPPHVILYPAVMLAALAAGWRAGLLSTLIGAVLAFLTLPRQESTQIFHPHDAVALFFFVLNGIFVSFLAAKFRNIRIESAANRMSEERFRTLAETLPHNVWSADGAGAVDYYNQRAYTYSGMTHSGPEDSAWSTLLHPVDLERSMAAWKRSVEIGQDYQIEHRWRRADGTYRWHTTRAVPIRDNRGIITRWIGTSTDIEEQKLVFEALRESEERFRILFEKAGDAIFLLKAGENDAGRIIAVNKAAADMHGYSIPELLEMKITDLDSPEAARDAPALIKRILKGEWIKQEITHFRKDGTLFPLELSAGMIEYGGEKFILAFEQDITERKRAELELRKREEEYRSLAENSPDFIARHDRQFRHIYVNNKIARFEGRDQQSFVGKTLEDIGFPAELADRWNDIFRRVFSSGKEESIDFSIEAPGGLRRYIHRTLVPELAPDGSVQTVLAIGRDITERKQAEEALRKERDKAQQYLDIAGAIIIAIDRDQRVSLINQKGCAVLGYTEEQILGRNWFDHFIPAEQRENLKRLFNQMVNGGSLVEHYENPVLSKDGSLRLVAWHNSATRDQAGKISALISSGEDITEHRRAEEALLESEERNRNLINFTPLGMLLVRDFKIDWVNKAATKMFAANSEKDLIDRTFFDLSDRPYHEALRRFNELKKGCPPDTREEKILRLDGALRDVEVTAVPFVNDRGAMILVMLNDITGRKQAEEALRETQTDYLRLFHGITDGIVFHPLKNDANPGNFVTANDTICRMLGYTEEEMRGLSPDDIILPEEVPGTALDREIIRTESFHIHEKTLVTKSGARIPVEISSKTFEHRGIPMALSVLRNITERKSSEESIKKLNNELSQNLHELAQANKELEAFVYSVSHDLRAPLMSIGGFADFLIRNYADKLDDKGKEHLNRVMNNALHMNQIIEDLLHLSRISRHELQHQEVDISAVAVSIVQDLRQAHPGREVAVEIQNGMTFSGDPGLIRIALSNLLRNAWKFTAKTVNARIEFGSRERENKIEYYVRDNGAGFDQHFSDKLFLPFHRLHSEQEFEGTGIGLAIVGRVIRRHGGSIRAEGKVNEGAAFFFTLS